MLGKEIHQLLDLVLLCQHAAALGFQRGALCVGKRIQADLDAGGGAGRCAQHRGAHRQQGTAAAAADAALRAGAAHHDALAGSNIALPDAAFDVDLGAGLDHGVLDKARLHRALAAHTGAADAAFGAAGVGLADDAALDDDIAAGLDVGGFDGALDHHVAADIDRHAGADIARHAQRAVERHVA